MNRRGRLLHWGRGLHQGCRSRLLRSGCRLLLSRLTFGFDRIPLMHGLLEAPDRLTDPFSQLRQFARSEDDQHNEEDQDQLCKTKTSKRGVSLRTNMDQSGRAALLRPFGESFLQPLPCLFGLFKHLCLVVDTD